MGRSEHVIRPRSVIQRSVTRHRYRGEVRGLLRGCNAPVREPVPAMGNAGRGRRRALVWEAWRVGCSRPVPRRLGARGGGALQPAFRRGRIPDGVGCARPVLFWARGGSTLASLSDGCNLLGGGQLRGWARDAPEGRESSDALSLRRWRYPGMTLSAIPTSERCGVSAVHHLRGPWSLVWCLLALKLLLLLL